MKTMSMTDFHAAYGDDSVLVDVREPGEYVQGHVPGALLMPLGQLPNLKEQLPKDKLIYVICRSGNRSKVGAEVLGYNGFDAVSVDGGTMAWINAGWDYLTGPEAR